MRIGIFYPFLFLRTGIISRPINTNYTNYIFIMPISATYQEFLELIKSSANKTADAMKIFNTDRAIEMTELSTMKDSIEEVIGWINKEALEFVKTIDKFDSIYKFGLNKYQEKCRELFN